jgi:hypothetical protein
MFLFHNRVLQCLACYWGWSCQFLFVGSTVWLPYLLDLFLLILVHVHTRYYYYYYYCRRRRDYHDYDYDYYNTWYYPLDEKPESFKASCFSIEIPTLLSFRPQNE